MPDLLTEIVQKSHSAIRRAQQDYLDWSGGYWLWSAPEHLLTLYIAQGISKIDRPFFLTLENSVSGAFKEAGGLGRGRPRVDLRLDGNFDLLVWFANGRPRTMIEVKNKVNSFIDLSSDIARICAVLNRNHSFRSGLVIYYISFKDGRRKLARQRVEDRVTNIFRSVRAKCKGEALACRRFPGRIIVDGDSAWTGEILSIQR